ncbi:MAG: arginine--tRNA ligase [Deltaproteobacteria bacterium]|nr:arginine--tRNA ligase [Deltaproteobacteria bacterium]
MLVERYLDRLATRVIRETLDVDQPPLLRPAKEEKHGDYQVNAAMALGKKLGKAPREIAGPLAEALAEDEAIARAEVAGPGFVNLFLDPAWIGARLGDDLRDTESLGIEAVETPQKVIVDFSSPNIAKQMHVGHLRSTIIGDALCRLLRAVGHEVVGDNHLGDWGTQFGMLIVGMREWGDEAALEADAIVELERVYRLASAKNKDDEAFADAARAELKKLQDGDADNRALWERFVNATRVALDRVYGKLDVSFDEWLGESAYDAALPGVVDLLLEKGIAREDDGAICVFWNDRKESVVPKRLKKQRNAAGDPTPFIIRKKDGAYLYSTTDVATVLHRRDHFACDRAIYVVDSRQGPHFDQLFTIMALLGVEMRLEHVGFGVVLDTSGKPIKTRDGKTITLESLLDEGVERAKAFLLENEDRLRIDQDRIDDVAAAVGIGAIKYADLHQNRNTDYQFDWEKMISLSGNSGPYINYAYARVMNIFVKGGVALEEATGAIALGAPEELVLGRLLLRYGQVVHAAAETCLPHLVCDHLYEVARAFSAFYEACPVLKSDGATRESRLALAALTARQLKAGLGLLGITAVDRM